MFQSRWYSLTRIALILGVLAAIIFVAVGLPGSASAAPACGATCYVDAVTGLDSNDGTSGSPFKTIQFGVNSVDAGGTVHVAAGTYVEQVFVAKTLTLVGANPATTIIQAPPTIPASSNPDSVIVKIAGAAINVEMSGFTVSGPGPNACGTILGGIYVRDGAYANIHDNKILDVRDTGTSGCQNGSGIIVGRFANSTTGTADITNNIITGYQKTGILVDNTGSHADIVGNIITGDGPIDYIAENGIQISRGGTASISDNTISGHSYTPYSATAAGILLFEAGATTITGNRLMNNQIGIGFSDFPGGLGNTTSTITGNNISATSSGTGSPGFFGIVAWYAIDSPFSVDITGNTFSSNNSTGGTAIAAGAGYGPNAISLDITDNLISNWDYGVEFFCNTSSCGAGLTPLVFTNNSITGNNHGIDNSMGVSVNAENNWWGDSSGPGGAGPGTGDSVSTNVDYDPFLTTNPQPTKVNLSADDQLVCGPDSAGLTIDFSNVPNLYGYQFEVIYDATKATATGAFVNDWFDTSSALVPPNWDAQCAAGRCYFAAGFIAPTPPSGGGGTVAQIDFASLAPGTFNAQVTNVNLTDIDGFTIPFTSDTATLSFDVCGNASISGVVSLQGRLTPLDAGQVKLIDQGGNFPAIVVPFDATTGAFSIPAVPVMPNGSDYLMQASHILYVGTQKTLTDLDPGDVLANQNTRLWGGDADNSGLNAPFTVGVDITDIGCISGAFGGSPVACGTTDPVNSSTDINKDGTTNIQDLALAGGNYGKNPYQPW